MSTTESQTRRRRMRGGEIGPQPAAADLAQIQSLYDQGRHYDAYRATTHLAPIRDWRGPAALVLGGRLAHHLGAPRMADSLMLLAWRRAPNDQQARYFGIRALLSRRGPLEALEAIERYPVPEGDAIDHAEWLALKGQVLGAFRDFARAEALLEEAKRVAPHHHWIALESSSLFGTQDRLDEALAEARRGFNLQPLHPGGTLAQAQILRLLGRDEDAVAALEAGIATMQSSSIAAFLAALQTDRERFTEALETWQLFEALVPLIDDETRASLYGNLSHMQYLIGNIEESKRLAIASGDRFLGELAERLDESAKGQHRRLQLTVPFIKQHYVTCVPTTMAMLGRFWDVDLEHLAIAEQITYGGTATHRERAWAEAHGWIVRELTVTWEAAVALLDRGVPFTLTTTSGEMGHEQAVMGYDTHRRTLLIRDPSIPSVVEADAESLLKANLSSGPRGMVMIPTSSAHRLDGLDLPESVERDLHHRILLALDNHDRDEAERLHTDLTSRAPGGRIDQLTKQILAGYDRDPQAMLASIEESLALYPGDTRLLVRKQACLAELFRTGDRLTLLRVLARTATAHPIFLRMHAEALGESAADHDRAVIELRRYVRRGALDPRALQTMANVIWAEQRFDEATQLYRLASSLGDTNEAFASSFFIASAMTGKQEDALDYLRDRAERARARSALPARTLFWALTQLFLLDEAFAVLQEAMALRPDDGDLLLFAADAWARFSKPEADQLLERAEPITRQADFLATRAAIGGYRGQLQRALADWNGVLDLEPLSNDANQAVTRLLEQVEGKKAVFDFLERLIDRAPGYQPAYALLAEATREADGARHERAVRQLIAIGPNNTWAHRELAMHLANTGRLDEALQEAERAEEIAPADASGPVVRARVLMLAGRRDDARTALLYALDLSADAGWALTFLGATVTDASEREQLYADVFERVVRGTAYGDGLGAWYDAAVHALPPERMLELATSAVSRRAELWPAHSILIRQLIRMGRVPEALTQADQATARFPLQPVLRMDAASAYRANNDPDREAEALETTLRLEATRGDAAVELARLLQRRGEHDRAVSILTAAAAATPLDAMVQWMLGSALWLRGDRDESLDHLARAARLAPDREGIWDELRRRANEAGRPDLAHETAARLVTEKPGNASAWLALSALEPELSAQLTAVQHAITVDPRSETAYDWKAMLLVRGRRFDEALQVCSSMTTEGRPPLVLRGREAWVHAQMGDHHEAVERMQAVLRDEPDYGWGWFQLCQWHYADGNNEQYRVAAVHLTRVDSGSVSAWNRRAQAEQLCGDEKAAEQSLTRALELDPGNVFATNSMIDLHLENNRVARAAELLDAAEAKGSHPKYKLQRLRIAIRRRQHDTVKALLTDVAGDPSLDPDMVRAAIQQGYGSAHEPEVLAALDRAVRSGTLNPAAAAEQVRVYLKKNKVHDALSLIENGARQGETAGRWPAVSFLEAAAASRNERWLEAFGKRFPGWALRDTQIWGTLAYCQTTLKRFNTCISSMSDWAKRDGVQPWMLLNLVLCYRNAGNDAEASKVSDFALRMLDPDHSTPSHRVWAAFDAAVAGDLSDAGLRIGAIRMEDLNTTHQLLARMVWALVAAGRHRAGNWRHAAAEQLRVVVNARKSGQATPMLRRCWKLTMEAIRQQFVKSLFEKAWAVQMRWQL